MVKARHTKTARTLAQVTTHNAMIEAKWPKPPRWLSATVTVKWLIKDRRSIRDEDNIRASLKAYADGVADAGLIANDRGLRWGEVYQVCDRTAEPSVTLLFEERVP